MTRLLAANALLCLLMTCPLLAQPVPAPPTVTPLRWAVLYYSEPVTGPAFIEKHRRRVVSIDLRGFAPAQEGCRTGAGSAGGWLIARGQPNGPAPPDTMVFNRPRMAPPAQQVHSRCGPAAPHTLSLNSGPNLSISSLTTALHPETGFLPAALNDRPRDRWLAFDKVQHLTVSFLWTLGTQYTLVNKASVRERRALPISIGSSGVAGIGKEYYDLKRGNHHHFSRRDLVADAVGILLATGLILL